MRESFACLARWRYCPAADGRRPAMHTLPGTPPHPHGPAISGTGARPSVLTDTQNWTLRSGHSERDTLSYTLRYGHTVADTWTCIPRSGHSEMDTQEQILGIWHSGADTLKWTLGRVMHMPDMQWKIRRLFSLLSYEYFSDGGLKFHSDRVQCTAQCGFP